MTVVPTRSTALAAVLPSAAIVTIGSPVLDVPVLALAFVAVRRPASPREDCRDAGT
jgi:hypothetical protein